MKTHLTILTAGLLLGLSACSGDGLADEALLGDARLTVDISYPPGAFSIGGFSVRIAAFWDPGGLEPAPMIDQIEDRSSAMPLPETTRFTMPIFDAPGAGAIVEGEGGERFAVGRIYAYVDADEDGEALFLGEPDTDQPVATDGTSLLLYVPEELTAETSPTGAALTSGLHLVAAPMSCSPEFTNPDEARSPLELDLDPIRGAPESPCAPTGDR